MNVKDFTNLLQNPSLLNTEAQTDTLGEIVSVYPYFQAARALHLKGLKTTKSFKYNQALKETAAHTADRNLLFNLITSDIFKNTLETPARSESRLEVSETSLGDSETSLEVSEAISETTQARLSPEKTHPSVTIEVVNDPKETQASPNMEAIPTSNLEDSNTKVSITETGTPLEFNPNEKHSFSVWLELTQATPIIRTDSKGNKKAKKSAIIDKFLETNPKIVASRDYNSQIDIHRSLVLDEREIMTETLARVYTEQKKYDQALKAYSILSLKYPEKNSFFAGQMKAIKKLQKENK